MANSRSEIAVVPARIGGRILYIILGWLFVAVGIFGIFAGAGGSAGATAIGAGLLSIGGGFFVIAFVLGLAGKIELRLIDIQSLVAEAVKSDHTTRAENTQATALQPVDEAAEAKKFGIAFDGQLYAYGQYKYCKLSDALAYARTHPVS